MRRSSGFNSQSGKGGVAFIMEKDHGLEMPRRLQIEFSRVIQGLSDETGQEIDSDQIWQAFQQEFLTTTAPLKFVQHRTEAESDSSESRTIEATVAFNNQPQTITGSGNGPIDAFVDALKTAYSLDFRVVDYHQHATGSGADAQSACYVEIQVGKGETRYGVGLDSNIVCASLIAVCSAVNRAAVDLMSLSADGATAQKAEPAI